MSRNVLLRCQSGRDCGKVLSLGGLPPLPSPSPSNASDAARDRSEAESPSEEPTVREGSSTSPGTASGHVAANADDVEVPSSLVGTLLEAPYIDAMLACVSGWEEDSARLLARGARRGAPDAGRLTKLLSESCSELCGVDLPCCDACLPAVLEERQMVLKRKEAELERFEACASGLERQLEEASAGVRGASDSLALLLQEEQQLLAEVEALEQSERELTVELEAARGGTQVDPNTWVSVTKLARRSATAEAMMFSNRSRERRYQLTLEKLQHLTAYNDAFFVWHDGPFGTINGFRLGSLPAQPVLWVEINAALGQLALLLATVCNQTGFLFSKYRVIPQGSYSKIAKTGDERTTYELYFDNRMFGMRRLNQALKCLAQCMQEVCEYAEEHDRSLRLPYTIADGKINDLPVTLGKEVEWTRALKCLLTNLKWLLAWATRQTD